MQKDQYELIHAHVCKGLESLACAKMVFLGFPHEDMNQAQSYALVGLLRSTRAVHEWLMNESLRFAPVEALKPAPGECLEHL